MKKKLLIWLIVILALALIYLLVAMKLTPSWTVGGEVAKPKVFVEITNTDLMNYPSLARFLKNALRHTDQPIDEVLVLIRDTSGQGRALKNFFASKMPLQEHAAYTYYFEYQGKYYGLDILFQMRSPILSQDLTVLK